MKLHVLLFSFLIGFGAMESFAQTGSISGTVASRDGEPLPAATVQIKGTNQGRATDLFGAFSFQNVQAGAYTLIVRMISFEAKEVEVQVSAGQSATVDVVLEPMALSLDDVLVTAQKRNESIQDVPITMSSLSGAFLREINVQEFDAFAAYVPGLEVQIQSVNNPGFVVRGITSDDGDARVEPRVSVFQDGVSISKSRGSVVELYDLERVEVLKGPQGTLFGRGAQIGAVHIIQNKANNQLDAELTLGGGNFDERLVRGFVNAPLIENKLFARGAFIYNERDGFIDNVSGGDLNGKETLAFRGSLRFLPTNQTVVDLILNWQNDSPPGTSFKSGTFAPAGGTLDPTEDADLDRGNDLFLDRRVWGTTLLVDHSLGNGVGLNSISAYREFDSFESFDADGTVAPALWFAEDSEGKQFSQELRVTYDNNGAFSGFAGASIFWEDGSQSVPFETDERAFFALLSPLLGGLDVPNVPLVVDGQANLAVAVNPFTGQAFKTAHREAFTNFGSTTAFEFFADGTYRVTPQFSVTAGVRLTVEDVTGEYEVIDSETPGTLGLILGATPNNLFAPTNGRLKETSNNMGWAGRFVLQYDLTPETNVFGSVSRGRRPDVINVTASGTDFLKEEIVWSYELGVKQSFFQNRLSIDVGGFIYDYFNFQTSITELTPDGLVSETRDSGNASALGFETSVRFVAHRFVSFYGSYGYIDATFDDDDADGNPQALGGNRFRLTPEHSFSLGFNAEYPIQEGINVFLRPTYTFKSQVFFEETNLSGIEQDDYGLLNLRAGVSALNNRVELAFYAKNLLDEEYVIDAGNTGGAFGIPTFIAGPPRFIGLQLTGRFR